MNKTSSRVEFANTLRGIAALSVLLAHYGSFFGPERENISNIIQAPELSIRDQPIPFYMQWLISGDFFSLPAFGVALFFLISGFVIPFALQTTDSTAFCINRFFRIVPTYCVGFTITLIALWLCTQFFSTAWPYSWQEILTHYIPGIRDIMWSRHIDFVVWTLEIEIKFYIFCAVMIFWFRQQSPKVFLGPLALFLMAAFFTFLLPTVTATNAISWRLMNVFLFSAQFMIFMFIGVIYHYLHRGKLTPPGAFMGMMVLFGIFCALWWTGPISSSFRGTLSYAAAWLVFTLAYLFPALFRRNRLYAFFADISYPLYVVHGVAGFVALRILHEHGLSPLPSLMIVIVGAFLLAWLLHQWVEVPSQTLGRELVRKMARRAAG